MKGLYLILDAVTLLFPLLLSFDRKIRFVREWLSVLIASILIAVPFIIWDVWFTEKGIWGFNPDYLIGIEWAGLPLEEFLFFLVVPFACTFIYVCAKGYFQDRFSKWNPIVQITIVTYALILFILDSTGIYTQTVVLSALIVVLLWRFSTQHSNIAFAFVLSLLPFLVINGVLTGSTLEAPIVWYNDQEIVSHRIHTIPMEDVLYSFALIVSVILLYEKITLLALIKKR